MATMTPIAGGEKLPPTPAGAGVAGRVSNHTAPKTTV